MLLSNNYCCLLSINKGYVQDTIKILRIQTYIYSELSTDFKNLETYTDMRTCNLISEVAPLLRQGCNRYSLQNLKTKED